MLNSIQTCVKFMKMQKIIMLIHHRCLWFMFDQTTMARQEQQKSGSKCHGIPAFMCGRPRGNGSDNNMLKEVSRDEPVARGNFPDVRFAVSDSSYSQLKLNTAISRKVVGKSARDNPKRYCRWF